VYVRAVLSKLLGLGVAVGAASLVAAAFGGGTAAAVCAVVLLTAACAFHLRNVVRLKRWLRAPALDSLPQSAGDWEELYAGLARLLRNQHESATGLSHEVERFRLAGAAMPEGLVILDGDDRILWCNLAAERHFGLELARDAGQQVTYLVRQPQFAHYLAAQNYGDRRSSCCRCSSCRTATTRSSSPAAMSRTGSASKRCAGISSPTCRTSCARRSLCWSASWKR
jgi:PAS domain-containing protein